MWICRKCNMRSDGTGRICRACGGIIEEMPDAPSVTETVRAAEVVEEMPGPEGELACPNWKCPKCGAMVPGNFDVCWKCLTTKAGEQAEDAGELLAQVDENDQEAEVVGEDAELPEPGADDEELAVSTNCSRCGSTRIIPDLTILDQGEGSDGKLKAVIFGSPQALIFKDRQYGEIKADICGKCGHIELRVANPRELYEHYQKSRGLDRPFDTRHFSSVPCQRCRMMMVKGSSSCPHCGASQVDY